jgi:hypothetical protein
MTWFSIKKSRLAHNQALVNHLADQIEAGESISRHAASGMNVRALVEVLERRDIPYMILGVPGVGYLVGRYFPGDDKRNAEYVARLMANVHKDS